MDSIDKAILGYIMRDGPLTTAELNKRIFDLDDVYERHKRDVKLRYRLNKLVTHHALVHDTMTKRYGLAPCVICDTSTLLLHTASYPYNSSDTPADFPLDTGPVICFQLPDESLRIIFLEQDD